MEILFIIPEIDNKNSFILFHTSKKASPSLPTISYILATDHTWPLPRSYHWSQGYQERKDKAFLVVSTLIPHSDNGMLYSSPPRERLPLGPWFSGALRGCSSVLHLMYLHPKPLGFFHHHPIYDFFYHSFWDVSFVPIFSIFPPPLPIISQDPMNRSNWTCVT